MGTRQNRLIEAVRTSTHNLWFEQKYEKYQDLYLKKFQFLVVKLSIYLNRHVFVIYWFSFTLAYNRISHEYSSLFIIVIIFFLCFRFDALTELGAFMRTKFLCISVLRVASGPRVKLASCESALNPPVVCSTDHS